MGIFLADQTIDFLCSCALGMALGLLYDVFRLLRIAVPTKNSVVFVQDLLFWIGCAAVTFLFLLTSIDGRVRVFLLIGELLGAILYHFTLGVVVMAVSTTIIRAVKAILRGIFRFLLYPIWRVIYFLVSLLLRPVSFFSQKIKKSSQRWNYRLKVRRLMLYNRAIGVLRKKQKKASREEQGETM